MTTKRTAEERAESRYPYNIERLTWDRDAINWHERVENLKRDCFATCIREELEPLEATNASLTEENSKLRALVHALVDAVDVLDAYTSSLDIIKERALVFAKEQGFVPTNTTQDNG